MSEMRNFASEAIIKSKNLSKNYYDNKRKCVESSYLPGDLVYVLKEPRLNKLDKRYVGPYEILEVHGNHNVIVKGENNKQILKTY